MADTHRATAQGRKRWILPQRRSTDDEATVCRSADGEAAGNTAATPSPSRHLAVPFRGHISGGMRPGKKIVIFGVVDPHPDRFYVALTCGRGTGGEPPPDVALELCVRFRDRQVLRRACVSGSWGDVDRDLPYFPFIRGQPFKLELGCERSRLRLQVDGQQLADFAHRVTALGGVDTLWVRGCLTLTKLA